MSVNIKQAKKQAAIIKKWHKIEQTDPSKLSECAYTDAERDAYDAANTIYGMFWDMDPFTRVSIDAILNFPDYHVDMLAKKC